MIVGDVFPRRNLPGEAEQWGRTVETGVTEAQTQLSALSQELAGQNRNTASSLALLADQVRNLAEQQTALEVQQEVLQGTIDFLTTQTLYDQKPGVSGGSRPGVGAYDYEAFDPTYDCSISVTTAASGKLLISTGGAITSSGGGAGIGPEVVGGSLPDFTTSASAADGAGVGASRNTLVTLSPFTTYTVQTRRWWYGGSAQFVSYQAASLVVTRLA